MLARLLSGALSWNHPLLESRNADRSAVKLCRLWPKREGAARRFQAVRKSPSASACSYVVTAATAFCLLVATGATDGAGADRTGVALGAGDDGAELGDDGFAVGLAV